ncbi:MAG TPA: serine hydrolase domain-containing protein, partial [Candidatus Limnocylindrales bacterium]
QDPRWYEPGLTPESVARGLASVRPDRPVGSYEYSNLNYVLLGAIIEAASGQRYADYLDDHVFAPLGMASSSARAPLATGATGFRYLFGVPVRFEEPWPGGMVPAGYHISTAADLARFAGALASGGVVGGVDIVSGAAASETARSLGTDWAPLTGGPGTVSSQSGSTLTTNADLLVAPSEGRAVVVVMNANPTQLLGMPRGAAEIALDTLRLAGGSPAASPLPAVTSAYLVVDGLLVLLAGALAAHVWRARSWRRRWAARRGASGRWLAIRTLLADALLPLLVLTGLPLLVGATGSSRGGDIIGGWRFVAWTLPDLAAALLALSLAAIALGGWKLAVGRRPGAEAVPGGRR